MAIAPFTPGRDQTKFEAAIACAKFFGAYFGGIVDGVADLLHIVAQFFHEMASECVVHVDDRCAQTFPRKQFLLGRAVLFHRAVIIEMVAREIGEHGNVELDAVDTVLIERVRRHFHGDVRRAGIAEFGEQSLAR